jgi:hypothetical protein
MTRLRLPPYPCVTNELREAVVSAASLNFSCPDGPLPGERLTGERRFTFGNETDWSIEQHPLQVDCRFACHDMLVDLFGAGGLVCRNARLMLVLEWVSGKSSRRGFSKPYILDHGAASKLTELTFSLNFPSRDLAGNIELSLELFVGAAGKPGKDERHLANAPGLRLGSMSDPWHLIFDGSGSLFPILHVSHATTAPLWTFQREWEDPTFDEFSTDYVSLEINTSHPSFRDLYGDAKAPYSTPLFRQVLAAWLMLFLHELENDTGDGAMAQSGVTPWQAIVEGKKPEMILPGSIAKAAREFVTHGNLDVSSKSSLLYSAQRWIDERFATSDT